MQPKDKTDIEFAARCVIDGLLPQKLMEEILKAQDEVMARGKPMTVAQICVAKKWLTRSEARYLLSPEHPPGDLIPGYSLKDLLGQGGMSRVFAAESVDSRRSVALKILKPSLARNQEARERFLREAGLLLKFDHENIVKGYELIESDGLVAFAMELVPGLSLLELIEREKTIPEDAALYVILQIARALTHMYSHRVVHRDIKPGNVLIKNDNSVKLCDLGLAREAGTSDAEGGRTVGTVAYISPEQAMGEAAIDVRSDIYALGVTLYHMVVGEVPFQGNDDEDTMARRFMESLSSPKLRHVSPHVHYFIQKMMAPEREIRYQSPKELIADVEESIHGKKTLSLNTSAVENIDLGVEKSKREQESRFPGVKRTRSERRRT